MKKIQVTNEKFIEIYHYILVNKIPFRYKYNGCSQHCGNGNPRITLHPIYSRHEFNIFFEDVSLFEKLSNHGIL